MECYRSETFLSLTLVVEQRTVRIRTLLDAANALLTHWVDDDGEEYVVAVKECLDAITGKTTVEIARAAFIRAVDEAGMRIIALVHSAGKPLPGARSAA
jgi:hypothetical protein